MQVAGQAIFKIGATPDDAQRAAVSGKFFAHAPEGAAQRTGAVLQVSRPVFLDWQTPVAKAEKSEWFEAAGGKRLLQHSKRGPLRVQGVKAHHCQWRVCFLNALQERAQVTDRRARRKQGRVQRRVVIAQRFELPTKCRSIHPNRQGHNRRAIFTQDIKVHPTVSGIDLVNQITKPVCAALHMASAGSREKCSNVQREIVRVSITVNVHKRGQARIISLYLCGLSRRKQLAMTMREPAVLR